MQLPMKLIVGGVCIVIGTELIREADLPHIENRITEEEPTLSYFINSTATVTANVSASVSNFRL
jgi:hypothetical protein